MKILIIRFSSIGDIVLTSPIIRCIKEQLDAEIHYLTKSNYQSLLSPNPHIDRVYVLQDSLTDLCNTLLEEKYDFIVDLHKNLRSWNVIGRLRVVYGNFDKANLAKWLMVNFKKDLLPRLHIVERYFQAVKSLRVKYDGKGLDYFLPEGTNRPFPSLHYYTVIAIGGAHKTKKLPVERMKSICESVKGPLVLVGGPEDQTNGDFLAEGLEDVTNLSGKLSIAESAALIRDARLVITHDTGMMHIAAAFKRSIISIWGNTIPGFGMYPLYPDDFKIESAIFEVRDLPCRPCSKIGFSHCPKRHFACMNDQDLDAIGRKANEILSHNAWP